MRRRQVVSAVACCVARNLSARHVRLCVLMLGCVSVTALAQRPTDPFEACSRVANPGARLACFDHAVRDRRAAAHGTKAVPVAPAARPVAPAARIVPAPGAGIAGVASTTPQTPRDTIGLDGRQLLRERKAEAIQRPVVKPIVAAIARLRALPGHQYYFELSNGEVWESTDTEPDSSCVRTRGY